MNNVVDIGEWSLRRKKENSIQQEGECNHYRLDFADKGDVILCRDCGVQVSAYWALTSIAERFNQQLEAFKREKAQFEQMRQDSLHLVAAKQVEKAWRSRTMVPACPHCHRGILSSDGLGRTQISKAMEERRRLVVQAQKTAEIGQGK